MVSQPKGSTSGASVLCRRKGPSVLLQVILDTPRYLGGCGVYVIENSAVVFLPQVPYDVDGRWPIH
jgi:hypothetical protein